MGNALRIGVVFLLFGARLSGQDSLDISIKMDTVNVKVLKLVDYSEVSTESGGQLDEAIGKNGAAFIKNYGAGQISSISVRGTGARHTKLYWDGVPLNSPMLGEVDFSLLPVFYFDGLGFVEDARRLDLGEGAFGTSINLKSSFDFKDKVSIRQQISSLMNSRTELSVFTSYKQFSSSTQVFGDFGKNRFQYKDELSAGRPKRSSEHTDYKQAGLMQQFRLKLPRKQQLSMSGWYQYSDRDFQFPKGNQKDINGRAKLEYRNKWNYGAQTFLKAAWLKETFNYKELKSQAAKVFLLVKHEQYFLDIGRFGLTVSWEEDDAIAQGYQDGVNQSKGMVAASFNKFIGKRYRIIAVMRELMVDGKFSPVLYAVSARYRSAKRPAQSPFSIKAGFSRDYNFPTINSRFWSPGGNPNLKPEHSYEANLSAQSFYEKKGRWSNFVKVDGYFKHINDWIQWTPSETSSFWEAKNVRTVNSTGVDLRANSTFHAGKHKLGIDGVYSFVSSKVVASEQQNDKAIGNQLIYTPSFQYRGALSWVHKNWKVQYWQEYTNVRYVTEDNQVSLPGYQVGSLAIGYNTKWRTNPIRMEFAINNIWNTDYRIVSGRPMPLRNFQLTVSTNLGLKKKQHDDHQFNK